MTSLMAAVENLLFSAAVSIIFLWIAIRKGFFAGWKSLQPPLNPPTLLLVLIAFSIYFCSGIILPGLLSHYMPLSGIALRIENAAWITFITGGATLSFLLLFCRSLYQPINQNIWKRTHSIQWIQDVKIAIIACLISFPIVIFSSQLFEIIVYWIFHTFQLPDQLVILFLKMTFDKPFYFALATISIIIFAPLIEELLFRGFLQSYLRRYMTAPSAIMIASACFALFHYSKEQGLGNIPIIGSLFVLANFLGFVYERRGSLAAPVILHALFNGLSIANLYFFGV